MGMNVTRFSAKEILRFLKKLKNAVKVETACNITSRLEFNVFGNI